MSAPVEVQAGPLDDEEQARAALYGLLAQLFYRPLDPALHTQLCARETAAPAPGSFLEANWLGLVDAARRLPLAAIHAEYRALFEGVGKPEVFAQASYHIAGALNEKPLAELRDSLRALGLERAGALTETEDHIACLCATMQCLIALDGGAGLATQQGFFNQHLRGWSDALWLQLEQHPRADFYRAAAALARDFLAIEAQAFDIGID